MLKKIIAAFSICLWVMGGSAWAQDMWTWMSGSKTGFHPGVNGTKGVGDAANVPGARGDSVSWTDSSGNLWLFGGCKVNNEPNLIQWNDLWLYNPKTDIWTWKSGAKAYNQRGFYGTKGKPHIDNVPGARGQSISWIDSSGNLWLFGGYGQSSDDHRDLMNDLWRYNPKTNMWTWVSGSKSGYQCGVYGDKGVPDKANVPGARGDSISWIDSAGNLWLFGGYGYCTDDRLARMNDLWHYNPKADEWTWMSGSKTGNQLGVYGIKGLQNDANVPGARGDSISWIDSSGNLWLFGGEGCSSDDCSDRMNDLWRYNPKTDEWTWMSGSKIGSQFGVYGKKGLQDAANVPGGRRDSISWIDSSGNLWLFGGYGQSSDNPADRMNDRWRYEVPE